MMEMMECERKLLPEAQELLNHVRSHPPARRVNNGGGNIMGFFPSWKTKKVLQIESLPELLYAVCLECDPQVLEYYDQPFRIPVVKQGKRKPINSYHVPDWLILTKSGLELHEVKRLDTVKADPSVAEVAEQARAWGTPKGIPYHVVTEEDQPEKTELENLQFLVAFRFAPSSLPALKPDLLRTVEQRPGILVADLARTLPGGDSEHRAVLPCIWHLCFTRELHIELRQEVLRPGSERRLPVHLSH